MRKESKGEGGAAEKNKTFSKRRGGERGSWKKFHLEDKMVIFDPSMRKNAARGKEGCETVFEDGGGGRRKEG